MGYKIIDLDRAGLSDIESRLYEYDAAHMGRMDGSVSIGIKLGGRLVAGADGTITAFRIFYVPTVFVDEEFRGKGLGRALMAELERRAKALGASMIRLDSFDFQGAGFYKKLGYEQVGFYEDKAAGFSETFFIKRL